MKKKLQYLAIALGLVLTIIGFILFAKDMEHLLEPSSEPKKISFTAPIIFLIGVALCYKGLIQTKHRSKKFEIPKKKKLPTEK